MPETQTARAAARVNKTAASGAKVTVASKMETGLRLRVFRFVEDREPVLGGGFRETKIARFDGEVVVNGVGKRLEAQPRCEVVNGYALTHGVDKDHWDRWLADNEASAIVLNGLIFADESADFVRDWCRENEARRSGLQALIGGDDPRAPRAQVPITDEDGRAKASPRQAA